MAFGIERHQRHHRVGSGLQIPINNKPSQHKQERPESNPPDRNGVFSALDLGVQYVISGLLESF